MVLMLLAMSKVGEVRKVDDRADALRRTLSSFFNLRGGVYAMVKVCQGYDSDFHSQDSTKIWGRGQEAGAHARDATVRPSTFETSSTFDMASSINTIFT